MGDLIALRGGTRSSEPWIGKRDAALHLGMSLRWVEKMQALHKLPFRQVAGINRYRRSELDAWIERMHSAVLTDDIDDR